MPVVYLNSPADFESWHLALRRLVKGYNMGDALIHSVPENQIPAMEKRFGETMAAVEKTVAVKKEEERKMAESGSHRIKLS